MSKKPYVSKSGKVILADAAQFKNLKPNEYAEVIVISGYFRNRWRSPDSYDTALVQAKGFLESYSEMPLSEFKKRNYAGFR